MTLILNKKNQYIRNLKVNELHPDLKALGKPIHLLPFAALLQDAGGVINSPVVFAYGQVGAFMLIHLNHQVVVLQLQLLRDQKGNNGRVWFLSLFIREAF